MCSKNALRSESQVIAQGLRSACIQRMSRRSRIPVDIAIRDYLQRNDDTLSYTEWSCQARPSRQRTKQLEP